MNEKALKQIVDLVGNTPIVEVKHSIPNVKVLAKLEYLNPSGSIKDRAAKGMLLAAFRENILTGKTLIEATSGNTGIAFAMLGGALGIPVEIIMPTNATEERKKLVANFGAKIIFTSDMEGTDGSQAKATNLVREYTEKYYYPDQYNNDQNWRAHFETTGPEIWSQSEGKVTHFVAGLGTSGTFIGTTRYLQGKGVECIAVQPNNPIHGLEGWKHMPSAQVPGIWDSSLPNHIIEADTEVGFKYAVSASRFLGLPLSPSSGANLWAALEIARSSKGGVVVTVFHDNSFKYLGDDFWRNNDYFAENPF